MKALQVQNSVYTASGLILLGLLLPQHRAFRTIHPKQVQQKVAPHSKREELHAMKPGVHTDGLQVSKRV